ncbi:MAG: GNAT family N-acetyltransferase [Aggregatilineales bacterium]
MPDIEVRRVQGEALIQDYAAISEYSFMATPPLRNDEQRRESLARLTERIMCILYEDGRPMTTTAVIPMTQQVRGKIYPMAGIASVASHPMGRRKGYVRQTIVHALKLAHDKGDIVSSLYPFRESFYQRMGYVSFPQFYDYEFNPATLTNLAKQDIDGDYDLMIAQDGFEHYEQFVAAMQTRTHGMALSPEKHAREWHSRTDRWLLLATYQGEPVGLMTYYIDGYQGTLTARNFLYHTARGRYLLLGWLARHTDQVSTVRIRSGATENPQSWLADMNPVAREWVWGNYPMGRVLDVRRLDGMTTGDGHFTAKISDPLCEWNNGIFSFDTFDGKLTVSEAENADCDLTIQGLSALIYGTHDPDSFEFLGWGNPSHEIQAAMQTIFPTMRPYMYEAF